MTLLLIFFRPQQALQDACPNSPWRLTFSYGRALQSTTLKVRALSPLLHVFACSTGCMPLAGGITDAFACACADVGRAARSEGRCAGHPGEAFGLLMA